MRLVSVHVVSVGSESLFEHELNRSSFRGAILCGRVLGQEKVSDDNKRIADETPCMSL